MCKYGFVIIPHCALMLSVNMIFVIVILGALMYVYCNKWQHRICGTGISQEYREAVRSREGLDWICGPCLVDINEDSEEERLKHISRIYFNI